MRGCAHARQLLPAGSLGPQPPSVCARRPLLWRAGSSSVLAGCWPSPSVLGPVQGRGRGHRLSSQLPLGKRRPRCLGKSLRTRVTGGAAPQHRWPRKAPPEMPRAARAACCASVSPESLWVLREQGQSSCSHLLAPELGSIPTLTRERWLSWYLPCSGALGLVPHPPPEALGSMQVLSFQPAETTRAASPGASGSVRATVGVTSCCFCLGVLGRPVHCWVLAIHGSESPSTTRAGQERGTCNGARKKDSRWSRGRTRRPDLAGPGRSCTRRRPGCGAAWPGLLGPLAAQCPPLPRSSQQMGFLGLGRPLPRPCRWDQPGLDLWLCPQPLPEPAGPKSLHPRGLCPSALASRSG